MKITKKSFKKTLISSTNRPAKDKVIVVLERSKKEYFREVTHELKNSLTIIIGYTQLLNDAKFSTDELYLKALANIEDESVKLNSIIDSIARKTSQVTA
ncbi:MAG: histidine kinase dimerization/phospho-acceptor domain-containing protein [Vulcanibacillus sp.]